MKLIGDIDTYVDFKGWRFFAPFRCMCCGVWVPLSQFCFGRACGNCDCGHCRHPQYHGIFSGPRQPIVDRDVKDGFIPDSKWLNPATGLESHPNDENAQKAYKIFHTKNETPPTTP